MAGAGSPCRGTLQSRKAGDTADDRRQEGCPEVTLPRQCWPASPISEWRAGLPLAQRAFSFLGPLSSPLPRALPCRVTKRGHRTDVPP